MVKTYHCAVIVVFNFLCMMSSYAETPFSFVSTPGQLSKNIIPLAYNIHLKLNPAALILKGHEDITINVKKISHDIVLNQAGLYINSAVLDNNSTYNIIHNKDKQIVVLHFERPLKIGNHVLKIDYSGDILTTPNGLYSNDYKTLDGRPRRMLVTQFEVADARRMFPVWDEPIFKAVFRIKVTLPSSYVGVSNMPLAKVKDVGAGWKTLVFQSTPKMSSYLLAFVAGDMGSLHDRSGKTDLGVYAPEGKQYQGRYALKAAKDILPYYNDYFGIDYPLPKMDMLAIPGNYQAGAMENWGALTYIDNDILFDEKNSTLATKELIYEVVAHEMAHQWSGDLVTMGWWNNLWLNEGFASWMEIKATDKFNPEWDLWTRQHSTREKTMQSDALSTTHAIQQNISSIEEAQSLFDDISYGKGELVIRMLESWLGEERFKEGMRDYMKAHAYSNTTSQDLWNSLTKVSKKNVAQVAKSFTEQKGFPQLNVSLRCYKGKAVYTLTQQRFIVHGHLDRAQYWNIPIVVGGTKQVTQKIVLGKYPMQFMGGSCDAPLSFNWNESGYYRVHYDMRSLALLDTHISEFSASDRVNILGDQYALFQAGQVPLLHYLDEVQHILKIGEDNDAVLKDILEHIDVMNRYEEGRKEQSLFQERVRRLLKPSIDYLGWEDRKEDSVLDKIIRPSLIKTLGLLNEPDVMREIEKRFNLWKIHPESLRADLVEPVLSVMMRHADEKIWNNITQKIQQADSTEIRLRLFSALSYVSDANLIEKTVQFAYSGAIPNGRINRVLIMMALHSAHSERVWESIVTHKLVIREKLTPESQDTFLADVAAHMVGVDTKRILESDLRQYKSRGTHIAIRKALEINSAEEDIRKRARLQIASWLQLH